MKNVCYVNSILSNMIGVFIKVIILANAIKRISCSVDGISYMDPLKFKPLPEIPGSNPCNPLYWYPKNIPEYCYIKNTPRPQPAADNDPIPMPIPVPQPIPIPAPMPPLMPPLISPLPPVPVPLAPLPYGLPIAPSNPMLPVAGAYAQMPPVYPYPQAPPVYPPYQQAPHAYSPYQPMPPPYPPFLRQEVGMVPGVPGIVSPDGGINLLPFSDVYSDMLERQKNKMIRKRLEKIAKEYDDYPRMRFQRRRKFRYY